MSEMDYRITEEEAEFLDTLEDDPCEEENDAEEEWTEQDEERWQAWGRAMLEDTAIKCGRRTPIHHLVGREIQYTIRVYDGAVKVVHGASEALDALEREYGATCVRHTYDVGSRELFNSTSEIQGARTLYADADGSEPLYERFKEIVGKLKDCGAEMSYEEKPVYVVEWV